MVIGAGVLKESERLSMNVGYGKGLAPEEKDGVVGPTVLDPATATLVVIRALHPQVRLSLWRFVLSLQAGFEFRTGQISGVNDTFYNDGFVPFDLLLSGKFNAKFMIAAGFYGMGAFQYAQYLIGESTDAGTTSSSSWGLQFGVGYAF